MRRLNWLNIILVVVLLGLGVIIFIAFHNPPSDKSADKPTVAERPAKPSPAKPAPKQPSPSKASQNGIAAKPATPPATATGKAPAATPSSSNATSSELANTGPGETLSLLMAAIFSGAAMRYSYFYLVEARHPLR